MGWALCSTTLGRANLNLDFGLFWNTNINRNYTQHILCTLQWQNVLRIVLSICVSLLPIKWFNLAHHSEPEPCGGYFTSTCLQQWECLLAIRPYSMFKTKSYGKYIAKNHIRNLEPLKRQYLEQLTSIRVQKKLVKTHCIPNKAPNWRQPLS